MPEATAALAEPGHNNPPTLPEILAEKYPKFAADIDVLRERANALPVKIEDDEVAGQAADVVKDANALAKKIDGARVAEKEPHLTAGREIDGFFKGLAAKPEQISVILNQRSTNYLRAKREAENARLAELARIEREDAARKLKEAQEAEEANRPRTAALALEEATEAEDRASNIDLQASAPREPEKIHSTSGTAIATQMIWAYEIQNFGEIDLNRLRPYIDRETVEKALRAHIRIHKGAEEIPGVRIFEDVKASIR